MSIIFYLLLLRILKIMCRFSVIIAIIRELSYSFFFATLVICTNYTYSIRVIVNSLLFCLGLWSTILLVQVEQSVWCEYMCVCLFIGTIAFWMKWSFTWHLACWFTLAVSRSSLYVKVHSYRSSVVNTVGVTLIEGFLVCLAVGLCVAQKFSMNFYQTFGLFFLFCFDPKRF